ncbi:Synphilin-1 [Liparis tanakae]|uniref:Synphilin-1 n=1 Tax=Liparis tanakae TaxID=230148 RepID=A0A4Z2EUW2_9TELE|nr:Synphilin-1 [Liparis tanakae]
MLTSDLLAPPLPAAPAINWSRSASSHGGGGGGSVGGVGVKPTGLPEAHSKFRPVKRVSPLKHQPETTDSDSEGKVQEGQGEAGKDEPASSDKTAAGASDGPGGGEAKGEGGDPQALFGELEHYDLDMDEILDVPYIKSSQQMSTLPRVAHDKRSVMGSSRGGGGTLERRGGAGAGAGAGAGGGGAGGGGGGLKSLTLPHSEPLSLGSSSSQAQVLYNTFESISGCIRPSE